MYKYMQWHLYHLQYSYVCLMRVCAKARVARERELLMCSGVIINFHTCSTRIRTHLSALKCDRDARTPPTRALRQCALLLLCFI